MTKRTIKPPVGKSRITLAEATAAARHVYRDARTGKFIISKHEMRIQDKPATSTKR